MEHAPEAIERHRNRLREAGYKLTHARLTVLQVVHELGGHVTSSEVLEAVHSADASIGRASVFRTLDLLTQLCIIRPTYVDSSMTPQYVMLPGGHHHHIICTQCNQVIEFKDCGLDKLAQRMEKEFGVDITGHLLEFYGVCEECRNKAARNDEN